MGKAQNLRVRVRQYVAGHDERFMVRFLVAQAADVEVVLTGSSKEALILENTLIKQHRPRYNVKLRDDKNFLHLRLDTSKAWPRYTLVRNIRADGARYFGPYAAATRARRILDFVQRTFPLRTCSDQVLTSRARPCILHQMGRCVAPCVDGLVDADDYAEIVTESALFLEGRKGELVDRLQERMLAAAEKLAYEEAARHRDLIRTLKTAMQRQEVVDKRLGDRDVWGLAREGRRGMATLLPVRNGQLLEPTFLPLQGAVESDEELLSTLLNTWYGDTEPPAEVLLPKAIDDQGVLEELLSERLGRKVRLAVPSRGHKRRVMELAHENARDRLRRHVDPDDRAVEALSELARICDLDAPPHRIECFDNSNLQGEHPVASQVTFLGGQPAKKHYRTYTIKTVVGADDFASMREVIGRRFRRAAEEGVFPDLLVVDGGRGQLSSALDALRDLGLEDQPVIGLSKPRTEKRRGEHDAVDKILVPGKPILRLPDHAAALNLLRHLRDESHRFAISFHRRTRRKAALLSELDQVPGVGPTRRKALLRHFGSLRKLRLATTEEIAGCPGIGPGMASKLHAALSEGA